MSRLQDITTFTDTEINDLDYFWVNEIETSTATLSIASPCVVSKTAHNLEVGNKISFTTTGALPTGLTASTNYYIISSGFGANSFRLSATFGGTAINTSGTQSGVHTYTAYVSKKMSGEKLKTLVVPSTPASEVAFDKLTPTTAGVVFTPNTPTTTNILYYSTIDGSTWIWNGSVYISYVVPSATEWYLYGTTIDAGSNKTDDIQRSGAIYVSVDSYFNDVRVGQGSGSDSTNTIVGDKCLQSNTTGIKITAVGTGSLQSNNASNNTAFGWGSLNFNSSGTNNTGVGSEALLRNVTGSNNSAIGYQAGEYLANGSTANTTPENSVFLGYSTRSLTNNDTNQIVIGYLALGKGSNTVQLGNTSVTATYLQGEVNINPVSGQISRAIINSDNNVGALLSFRTANLPRWAIRKDGNETGSNVGGDLSVRRYDDAGAFIDNPISIKRSTGAVTLNSAYALPTVAPTSGQVLGYLGAGTTQWLTSAGGLTYFTEAQNTTAPNATVPVDSLTAVTGTTNGDFAIIPKGAGALISQIPDGTATGGNKRGARAVDFQRSRTGATQVASGADTVILSGINNRATGTYSVIGGGSGNDSSGAYNFVFGRNGFATGDYVFEFGNNGGGTASGGFGFLSASTASGATSFNGTATGTSSFAKNGVASGAGAFVAGGVSNSASGTNSFATNDSNNASGKYSACFGVNGSTKGIASRISLGVLQDISPYLQGNAQVSTGVVTTQTTTNTAISLLVYNGTAIALPLQNNEAIRVKGSIIGKQSATTNVTSYDFDCVIVRGTTAASTVIKVNNMNLVWDDIVCSVLPTLTADTTNGGLGIKSGGKLTTTIKWTARIDSTESILA